MRVTPLPGAAHLQQTRCGSSGSQGGELKSLPWHTLTRGEEAERTRMSNPGGRARRNTVVGFPHNDQRQETQMHLLDVMTSMLHELVDVVQDDYKYDGIMDIISHTFADAAKSDYNRLQ